MSKEKAAAATEEESTLRKPAGNTTVQTAFKEEHLIYIGPSLPNGLNRYMVFRGGKPAHYLEGVPVADALFVPVAEFAARQMEILDPGKPLYTAYTAVESYLRGGA